MKKFTQQELMAAHNVARFNAEKTSAEAAADSTIPEPVNPNRKPLPFPYTAHPFGGNDNNRRVAERIANERNVVKGSKPLTPLSPADAAESDLESAEGFEVETDDSQLSDEEQLAKSAEQIKAGLDANAQKPTKPLTKAQLAKQVADAQAALDALQAGTPVGDADPNASTTPATPGAAPTWRGNA